MNMHMKVNTIIERMYIGECTVKILFLTKVHINYKLYNCYVMNRVYVHLFILCARIQSIFYI